MTVAEMSLKMLAEELKSKRVSSVEVVKDIIYRIHKTSELNNFITVCEEDAISAAERADERRARGENVSDLCGVPIAVKDNICTSEVRTTCASNALREYVPSSDAEVVKMLKAAGAVIIGKTNMDELAMGSTNTHSAFGAVKNARDNSRVSGGSSGGSANSVAAYQAFGALGSDTGGSIRQPAAYCGVVGLKPTFGAVSNNGLMGFAPSLDCIGVLARDCDDAAILYNAIKNSSMAEAKIDLSVKGKTVGIADEFFGIDFISDGVKSAFENAVSALEKQGAIVKRVPLKSFKAALAAYHVISSAECAHNITARLKDVDKSLFGAEVKRRMITGTFVVTGERYDELYIKAAKARAVIKAEYDSALEACDVLISPTAPNVATKLDEKLPPHIMHCNDMYAAPVSLSGLPAVSVPFGSEYGMPIGIQIIGRRFDEGQILSLGKALECANNG